MLLKTIRAFTRPEVRSSLSVLTDLLTTAVDDPGCSRATPPRMTLGACLSDSQILIWTVGILLRQKIL
jgi:hypothetical protein